MCKKGLNSSKSKVPGDGKNLSGFASKTLFTFSIKFCIAANNSGSSAGGGLSFTTVEGSGGLIHPGLPSIQSINARYSSRLAAIKVLAAS